MGGLHQDIAELVSVLHVLGQGELRHIETLDAAWVKQCPSSIVWMSEAEVIIASGVGVDCGGKDIEKTWLTSSS
ncbi:hypothetical protein NL676_009712 [Syzygium grande]|nr:hypothetical protein NL676_009712 [Syzygium grande]